MIAKRFIEILLIAAVAILLSQGLAFGSIGTNTLGVDVEVAPGQSVSGSFIITNGSDQPASVRVELADFERKVDGGVVILPPQASPNSLADYITFSPAEFTLPAGVGETQEVRFTINLASNATGPHWSMLLVQEIDDSEDSNNDGDSDNTTASGRVSVQLGIQIRQVDPSALVNDGRITEIEVVESLANQPIKLIADYENIGNTFQRPTGEVRIINSTGDVAASLDIAPFRMLPNSSRRLEFSVDAQLPPGEYVALVIIDFGGNFMLAGQVRFTIT